MIATWNALRTHEYCCVLLTGTGVVPPDEFTLREGDAIAITVDPIGTLENVVR